MVAALAWTTAAIAGDVHVTRFVGTLNVENYQAVTARILEKVDTIVGLQVTIDDETKTDINELFLKVVEETGFTTEFVSKEDGETVNLTTSSGHYMIRTNHIVDGFYLVKNRGMFQGTEALELVPVDEAQVILSGARIVNVGIDDE